MTSNAGSATNTNSIGFGNLNEANKNKTIDVLRQSFRPEFLNRIDEIVVFNALTEDQLLQIVDLMLFDTQKVLADKNITMKVSQDVKKYLLQKGTDLKYGARPLRRAIQRYIEDELSDLILKSELKNGQTIQIELDNDKLQYKIIN
jgi:ATP-dependent Clp protease ATP-binding subunit ClpE